MVPQVELVHPAYQEHLVLPSKADKVMTAQEVTQVPQVSQFEAHQVHQVELKFQTFQLLLIYAKR